MSWPRIRFVAEPDESASVRLDLSNDDVAWVGADDYTFGTPQFEGGPGAVGAEYGYRQISMTVHLQGSKTTALTSLSALAVEIQRVDNWILFQLQPDSVPVWFRTYRTQPGELSLDAVYDETTDVKIPDRWDVSVQLDAEPFSYGARETLVTSAVIGNDPATGSNRLSLVLPTIKGDAPTDLRVSLDPSIPMGGYKLMVSSLALKPGATYTAPYFWQVGTGDSFNVFTDTSAPASDTWASGGSYRTVSFATDDDLVKRISGTMPSMPSGLYKVLARVRRSDTDSTFSARFGQTVGGIDVPGLTTAVLDRGEAFAAHTTWLDLGEFTFPHGGQAPTDVVAADGAPAVFLQAARLSGDGQLYLDALAAIPVQRSDVVAARTLFSEFDAIGPASGDVVSWEGSENLCWVADSGGVVTAAKPILTGAFPRAVPGRVNVLHVFQQVNGQKPFLGTDSSDALDATVSATITYHPRYLWLAAT